MAPYQYLIPASKQEALEIKASLGQRAGFIAGGTDILVLHRAGQVDLDALISLRHIPEFSRVRIQDDHVVIGATTTISDLLADRTVADELPILRDALAVMASTQIRNVATVGGNVMSAVSSGDTLSPLLCLEAECLLASSTGDRRIPLSEFFTGPRRTAAGDDELLCELWIPRPGPAKGAYIKLGRRAAMDLAVVGVGVQLALEPDGRSISQARAAAGAVGPTPLRLHETEALLIGAEPGPDLWETAGETAMAETQPWDDVRAAKWYRREMVKVLLIRAARAALDRLEWEGGPDA